jgi:hydrogenase maturation factor
METSPERLFFEYAFTALASCANVSDEKISELEKLLVSGENPTKEELEGMFPCAFGRIDRMDGDNEWSYETVKKYWWEEHNRIIDAGEDGYGDVPHDLSEPCKVSFVEVVELEKGKIIYYGKTGEDKKASTYFKDLEVGDFVTIHLGRVVEKISEKDFKEYSKK